MIADHFFAHPLVGGGLYPYHDEKSRPQPERGQGRLYALGVARLSVPPGYDKTAPDFGRGRRAELRSAGLDGCGFPEQWAGPARPTVSQ